MKTLRLQFKYNALRRLFLEKNTVMADGNFTAVHEAHTFVF